jgi:hypothetical protein
MHSIVADEVSVATAGLSTRPPKSALRIRRLGVIGVGDSFLLIGNEGIVVAMVSFAFIELDSLLELCSELCSAPSAKTASEHAYRRPHG